MGPGRKLDEGDGRKGKATTLSQESGPGKSGGRGAVQKERDHCGARFSRSREGASKQRQFCREKRGVRLIGSESQTRSKSLAPTVPGE